MPLTVTPTFGKQTIHVKVGHTLFSRLQFVYWLLFGKAPFIRFQDKEIDFLVQFERGWPGISMTRNWDSGYQIHGSVSAEELAEFIKSQKLPFVFESKKDEASNARVGC